MTASRKRKGMTLLEILLVIAILGVIAALVIPRLVGRQKQANVDATALSIKGLSQALKMYAIDHDGEYPTTAQGLPVLYAAPPTGDPNWNGPYLETPALDAWGREFEYQYPGAHNTAGFDIRSTGADAVSGNEDDVVNWKKDE